MARLRSETTWKRIGTTGLPRTVFDYEGKLRQVAEIEARMSEPDFWNNQERAREVMGQLKGLKALTRPLDDVVKSGADLPGMLELAEADDSFAAEVRGEIERLETALDELGKSLPPGARCRGSDHQH
jgi:peptide chain release factor 2